VFPQELFGLSLSHILAVLVIAASPISELRGAIPVAIIGFHFPWYYAFLLAVIGNLLPVPFILLFFNALSKLLSRVSFFERILNLLFESTRRRGKLIEKYGGIGLALFVGVPLPMTGAWTGSLAAILLGLKFKPALLSIFAGIVIAGTIVTLATLLGWAVFSS